MIKICSVVKLHKRSWLLLIWCQKTASAIKYIGDKTVSLNVAAFTLPYVGHGQVGSRFGPPKNFGVTPPMTLPTTVDKATLIIDVKKRSNKNKKRKKRDKNKNVCRRWIKKVTYTSLCLSPNV